MATGFKCGVQELATGTVDVSVAGLSLSFTPAAVQVAVRQPTTEADLITAYVVGTPTASGFNAVLSAPPSVTGYLLEWTAFTEEVTPSPVAGDTLSADYASLKAAVAHFLGYDLANLTASQTSEIDGYIQTGIRNFYYPPALQGVDPNFEWSFLRQNGSVSLTAGVSDYTLPDGFGRIAGQMTFGNNESRFTVPVVPYGDVARLLASPNAPRGIPRIAAIASTATFGNRGQRKKLYVYPTPDKAYTLNFVGDADTGKIDAVNRQFPLGGSMYAELVTESCLAAAEQRANDEIGLHTNNFNALLVSTIARDRKSTAQVFGKAGDPDHRNFW